VELYLYFLYMPSWNGQGLYIIIIIIIIIIIQELNYGAESALMLISLSLCFYTFFGV
jgi:hypothetical protein